MSSDIKHVFVLMMENRSFDHLLGFSGVSGVQPPAPSWGVTPTAGDRAPIDPPHEFENVQLQMAGSPPMSGFARQSYANVSLSACGSTSVPVLQALAQDNLLFDNWYSSMPGPTWPNRFFVHAASSGGLDNSPSGITSVASATIDALSFDFEHGTVFQQLERAGKTWRVYHDDLFPQVLAIKHMIDPFRLNTAHFSWTRLGGHDFFSRDLNAGYSVDYTFVEPNYGLASANMARGSSQHPTGSLAAGEAFIKYIYDAIRNSPVWPNCLLLIAYDEHGGFFDHLAPPPVVPPGDDARNHQRAQHPMSFGFDRLGVRVPVVAISPRVPAGALGSQLFPGKVFDHSAVIATLRDCFDLGRPLTHRDAAIGSIASACSLVNPRHALASAPTPRQPADLRLAAVSGEERLTENPEVASHTLEGFGRIAMSVDLAIARAHKTAPLAAVHPLVLTPKAEVAPGFSLAAGPMRAAQLLDYIKAVAQRRQAGP
ncbi:MAG: alkaline phosphatase family protein [Proteobacteria bacterium]|nr:alkaline phosphatase family protein [Pseudomonadota bacterium]